MSTLLLDIGFIASRRLELGYSLRDMQGELGSSLGVIKGIEDARSHAKVTLPVLLQVADTLQVPASRLLMPEHREAVEPSGEAEELSDDARQVGALLLAAGKGHSASGAGRRAGLEPGPGASRRARAREASRGVGVAAALDHDRRTGRAPGSDLGYDSDADQTASPRCHGSRRTPARRGTSVERRCAPRGHHRPRAEHAPRGPAGSTEPHQAGPHHAGRTRRSEPAWRCRVQPRTYRREVRRAAPPAPRA